MPFDVGLTATEILVVMEHVAARNPVVENHLQASKKPTQVIIVPL